MKDILKSYLTAENQKTGEYLISLLDSEISVKYLEFFEFMKNEGYSKYINERYLSKIIDKFSKQYETYLEETVPEVYGKCDDECNKKREAFVKKYKGNVFEMIIYKLLISGRFNTMQNLEFDSWEACKDDNGSDGYMHYKNPNTNQLIGVNVKYRFESEINDNDKIWKTYVRTTEKMRSRLRNGEISDEDFNEWSKLQITTIVFTTTRPKWYMETETMFKWFTEIELYKTLGNLVHDNVSFWKELYEDLL